MFDGVRIAFVYDDTLQAAADFHVVKAKNAPVFRGHRQAMGASPGYQEGTREGVGPSTGLIVHAFGRNSVMAVSPFVCMAGG
ncbi:MAG: hypothetical protein H0S85_08205 [Desulfovibrionaceae bacterium]|nr:hypothetical protein [Desulfovibrionaceae bacterium]